MVSHVVDTNLMLGFVHTQKKKEKKRKKNQRENITINYAKKIVKIRFLCTYEACILANSSLTIIIYKLMNEI